MILKFSRNDSKKFFTFSVNIKVKNQEKNKKHVLETMMPSDNKSFNNFDDFYENLIKTTINKKMNKKILPERGKKSLKFNL